jgi:hypothetical protein
MTTTIIIIGLLLTYIVILFLKSKNNFFSQDREVLAEKRQHLIKVLLDFNIDVKKDKRWLRAFDSFRDLPSIFQYDGATIVKDLHTIYGYDASAANHDLWYIENKTLPFFKWLVEKLKADYQYGIDMRKLQIPYTTAWSRVVGLWISTPIYPIILLINKK